MTVFKYSAISKNGIPVSGVVEAYDEFEAVEKIRESCKVVIKVAPVEIGSINLNLQKKVSEKALAVMCSQFSIILGAGMPIVRTTELIAEQTVDKHLKKTLKDVASDVASGFGIAQSFEKNDKKLPSTFIETIRAGESSGTLDVAFEKLSKYYDKSYKTKAKIISSLIYPVFTLIVAVIVVAIIMLVAVPMFTNMFKDAGTELPLPTRILIGVSDFMTKYIVYIVMLIAASIISIKFYGRTEKGKHKLSELMLKLPLFGKINVMRGASQFASTMSTMLAAGVPIIYSLAITGRAMDSYFFGKGIQKAAGGVEEGKRLGECISVIPHLPSLLIEMTAMGEETGSLESTLETISAYYNNEAEIASAKIMSLLEPVIICVLAVIVVFILLSVYLPMFSMYNSI